MKKNFLHDEKFFLPNEYFSKPRRLFLLHNEKYLFYTIEIFSTRRKIICLNNEKYFLKMLNIFLQDENIFSWDQKKFSTQWKIHFIQLNIFLTLFDSRPVVAARRPCESVIYTRHLCLAAGTVVVVAAVAAVPCH